MIVVLGIFIAANGGAYEGLQELSRTGALVYGLTADMIGALWPAAPAPSMATSVVCMDRVGGRCWGMRQAAAYRCLLADWPTNC